jgi:gliding motility-associated-like protein
MKANRINLIILFSLFSLIASAQKKTTNCPAFDGEANVWFFGEFAGLNFKDNPPEALTYNSTLQSLEGNACISDSLGNFVFALSGNIQMDMFNSQLERQSGFNGIGGNVSATQPAIIIPRPGQDYIYDLFLLNLPIDHPNFKNGLVHTIVDLSNPLKPVMSGRPDTLLTQVAEGITAVNHRNQEDVWVLVHEWESDNFLAYLIGAEGLLNRNNPVRSPAGSYRGGETNNAIGTLKFSPDGSKVAYTCYNFAKLELFDFNNTTGQLSLNSSTAGAYEAIYGCGFSANSTKLYISTTHLDIPDDFVSRIYQFDLDSGANWPDFPTEIAADSSKSFFCGMQLAVDGKIYVARSPNNSNYIGIIQNPGRPNENCNFNKINNYVGNGLRLGDKHSAYGLPNFNQSYFNRTAFRYESNCFSDNTKFHIINQTNVDSVRWDFGDGTFSIKTDPAHHFASPGNYQVKLHQFFDGSEYISTSEIIINPLPVVEVNGGADTILMFSGSTVRLEIAANFRHQEWSNGSTRHFIEVSNPGYYWVGASDGNCCFKNDTVFVKEIRIFIPNAFIPASSGADASFGVVDMDNAITEMTIIIYDRWGKQVKELKDKFDSWDGNGQMSGVYFYTIKASMVDGTNFQKNGNVTLLR